MRNLTRLWALIAVAGCDQGYDPDAPAIDPNAPRVHITAPARGTIAGEVSTVTVTGTVTDDSGVIASLTVNDVSAQVGSDGSFSVEVAVEPGTNLLHAVAKDDDGNTGQESRAVVAGPMSTLARQIPDAITATLSAQTFDAVGRSAAGFIKTGNLMSVIAPYNPVVDAGDGPDCLYGTASITSMTVGDAAIQLTPQIGGVALAAELSDVHIGMHLQWSASCLDGATDIVVGASHISVHGNLLVGIIGRDFDIRLTNQIVQITGFDLQLPGVPGKVVELLSLDTAISTILGWATERFVVPMLNKSLAGLNEVKTIDVLGSQVDIDVKPSLIQFTPEGGTVRVDTSLRAHGDTGNFVFVASSLPAMDMSHGFQLAVADDAANQLLTSVWSAKGMDTTLVLTNGSYGELGKLCDSVQLETSVPPFVDADGAKLVLTVGDVVGSFKLDGAVTTRVAINAQVELAVSDGPDGKLRFDVGEPKLYVDILEDGVAGANPLSNAEFEDIVSFALSRLVAVASGQVGAIPLPAFGGVAVTDLAIAARAGYLVVDGDVK